MTPPAVGAGTGALIVPRASLRLGAQLAEGGEGRVYELPDRPGVLYKEYRRPWVGDDLGELVAWPDSALAGSGVAGSGVAGSGVAGRAVAGRGVAGASLRSRVRAASAWPIAVVAGGVSGAAAGAGAGAGAGARAAGLLMPRAPRRFSVRHRDGVARLATLSYLTADPGRRSSAYGLSLPAQGDPQRMGIVYALARLLEAFEAGAPAVGHGDLSAKNILWSLVRGPEVFVLDCDNGERFDAAGAPLGTADRRRAMTPNWDDPTAEGANPGVATDRYSLGLIFLRLVGAAHFPVQKRQKAGEAVDIALDLPPALLRTATMAPDAPIWALVSRSLGTDPAARPPASTWAAALRDVLVDLGAGSLVESVHVAHGSDEPSVPAVAVAGPPGADVTVAPRPARPRSQAWARATVAARPGPGAPPAGRGPGALRPVTGRAAVPAGGRGAPPVVVGAAAGTVRVVGQPPAPIGAQARTAVATAVGVWLRIHRSTLRRLRAGQSGGKRRLVACLAIDFALACVALALVAMIVSPFLGI